MRLLPGALGVLLLLALLTWLLLRGIDTNAPAYAVTLRAFDDFALAEASLHRDVLQARAGLLRNYDTLVKDCEGNGGRGHPAPFLRADRGPRRRTGRPPGRSSRAAGGTDGALQEQQRALAEFAVLCWPAEHKSARSAPRTHNSHPQPAHWQRRSSISRATHHRTPSRRSRNESTGLRRKRPLSGRTRKQHGRCSRMPVCCKSFCLRSTRR